MKYLDFKNRFRRFPLIDQNLLASAGEDLQILRNQLTGWQKRGLVQKLRNGFYILNESDRLLIPSRFYMANQVMSPSYVSLESALHFYGIIPESVKDVTLVTTRKTVRFETPFGLFRFHHISPPAFCGFEVIRDEAGLNVLVAKPEKALLDLIYFHKREAKAAGFELWFESLRIQLEYPFKLKLIRNLAANFRDPFMERLGESLMAQLKRKS